MEKSNQITIIELIRNKEIVDTINTKDIINDSYEMSLNHSLYDFPFAKINTKNDLMIKLFMHFSDSDILRIRASFDEGRTFKNMFEGEFYSKKINFSNDDKATNTLEFEAIHSLYKLSLFKLSSIHTFNNISFIDFIIELLNISNINIDVKINKKLGKTKIKGLSKNTNTFGLLKEVCFMLNASIELSMDNKLSIDYIDNKIKEFRSKEPISLKDKDIISFNSNEKLG